MPESVIFDVIFSPSSFGTGLMCSRYVPSAWSFSFGRFAQEDAVDIIIIIRKK